MQATKEFHQNRWSGVTGPTDPPIDPPGEDERERADWFPFTGYFPEDMTDSETRSYTIRKGKSRLVVVGLQSDEYPTYTDDPDWNDILEWTITPSIGNEVKGNVRVNALHGEWELAKDEGTVLRGFSPTYLKEMAVITAPGESDVTCKVTLAATNIGDNDYPSTVIVGLVPVEVVDNAFATGVDKVSKTADSADIGYQEDIWVMAPSGSPPAGGACENDTYFHLPVDESVELKVVPGNFTAAPHTFDLVAEDDPETPEPGNPPTLDTDESLTKVTWRGTSADTTDNTVQWKFGSEELEIPLPIKVKTMKNRTVRVAVWPVRHPGSQTAFGWTPEFKGFVSDYLDQIFAYQLDAWIKLDFKALGDTFEYTDGVVDGLYVAEPFGQKFKNLIDGRNDVVYDINVYLIYDVFLSGGAGSEAAAGIAFISDSPQWAGYENNCVVNMSAPVIDPNGSLVILGRSVEEISASSAHEIGHLLTGRGHPDLEGGEAPLRGSNRVLRLMCSGRNSTVESKLLVKKEWDEAEAWLKNNVDKDQP